MTNNWVLKKTLKLKPGKRLHPWLVWLPVGSSSCCDRLCRLHCSWSDFKSSQSWSEQLLSITLLLIYFCFLPLIADLPGCLALTLSSRQLGVKPGPYQAYKGEVYITCVFPVGVDADADADDDIGVFANDRTKPSKGRVNVVKGMLMLMLLLRLLLRFKLTLMDAWLQVNQGFLGDNQSLASRKSIQVHSLICILSNCLIRNSL